MAWTISYSTSAKKRLQKLDRQIARRIIDYMDIRIAPADNPRDVGKVLSGSFGGYWRYRVGDYRILCDIKDRELVVLVIEIGGRREIYR